MVQGAPRVFLRAEAPPPLRELPQLLLPGGNHGCAMQTRRAEDGEAQDDRAEDNSVAEAKEERKDAPGRRSFDEGVIHSLGMCHFVVLLVIVCSSSLGMCRFDE